MIFRKRSGAPVPAHLIRSAEAVRRRGCALGRREFLATASSFGVATVTAYAMLGLAAPRRAAAQTPKQGGVLRMQAELRAMKDPRTFDFNQLASFSRGWLEYLVHYNNDGTFDPHLLEGWDISDDARVYSLRVRPGVTWNDGAPFTARDVARNIERFCERDMEGNSMASRMSVMVDEQTGRAIPGAIEVMDDLTVRLNLPAPDISLIASLSDYAAAMVPESYRAETMLTNPVGTGPYLPESYEVGVRGVLVRNTGHTYWNAGRGGFLDRIEYIDYGTDPAAHFSAAEADEIDANFASEGEFVAVFDTLPGWRRNESVSAGTILARANQQAEVDGARPYADARVRRALAMAVDNAMVLELGYSGLGEPAENHHVCPIHPEYADIGAPVHDPAGALALMAEAGMADFEHDLVSLDGGFWRDTADAIGAQIRDAGIPLKRTVYPSSTFWNDWAKYPFSVTNWNHRPLGIQTLAIAYRTGVPWNETGFANAEFDALVDAALATPELEARREIMARLQTIMVEEGVIIQPYWRSMYNHCKEGLMGYEAHVAQEIKIDRLWWA